MSVGILELCAHGVRHSFSVPYVGLVYLIASFCYVHLNYGHGPNCTWACPSCSLASPTSVARRPLPNPSLGHTFGAILDYYFTSWASPNRSGHDMMVQFGITVGIGPARPIVRTGPCSGTVAIMVCNIIIFTCIEIGFTYSLIPHHNNQYVSFSHLGLYVLSCFEWK